MKIIVKSLTGKQYPMVISDEETVDSLKVKVEQESGLPVEQQKLIAGGKKLDDGRYLAEYQLKEEAIVYITIQFKGGG